MIQFQHVSKRYKNGFLALDNLSFTLQQGEFAFLTGHSGAGKSTLLKLIAALEFPTQGQVIIGKHRLTQLKMRQIPALRRSIGIILQTPNLLPDRMIFDNVALPLIIAGTHYREIQSRVRAILAKMGLHKKEKCFPNELSIGEQQRVSIARAIINKPSLLLADEPTGNLDADLAADIMGLFQQFNQLGMTMLIASHDVGLIQKLGHRVLTLAEGKLCNSSQTI